MGGGAGREMFSVVLSPEESEMWCEEVGCSLLKGLSAVHAVLGGGGATLFSLRPVDWYLLTSDLEEHKYICEHIK